MLDYKNFNNIAILAINLHRKLHRTSLNFPFSVIVQSQGNLVLETLLAAYL